MFENTTADKIATLLEMESRALRLCNADQNAAKQKMIEWAARDARYSDINPHRLVDYFAEKRSAGAQIDLDDPKLTGRPRPEYRQR